MKRETSGYRQESLLASALIIIALSAVVKKSCPDQWLTAETLLENRLRRNMSAPKIATKAAVAKAVTLEVDTVGAQKIWLAASVGSLSLLLRKAGEQSAERTRRVTLDDLSKPEVVAPERNTAVTTVSVQRGGVRQNYDVPSERARQSELASGGARAKGQ